MSNQTTTRVDELREAVPINDVPVGIVHDSVVTESLNYLGLRDAFVGRESDTGLAAETINQVVGHNELPSEEFEQKVQTLHLPVGKQQIIKAVSRECGRVTHPSEARVFTAFLNYGLDILESR